MTMQKDEFTSSNPMPGHRFIERELLGQAIRELWAMGWKPIRFECDGDIARVTGATVHQVAGSAWKAFNKFDEGFLIFETRAARQKDRERRWLKLVGGNGEDVISDYYSARDWNAAMNKVFLR